MCGIVGILNFDGSPVDETLLKEMTSVQFHRGPDGEGYYVSGNVGLGHRRLSIIDLEGGKQPMSNEDDTIWITFNGEIYNFQEIARVLRGRGHRFKTRSDTEVIIHAYEEWGEQCLQKFIGMFAFGIWDDRKKKLFLARDRLGIKPLHYYLDEKRVVFATELKSILRHNRVPRVLDHQSLVAYLKFGYVPSPYTIFKNNHKLLPGHYLTISVKTGQGAPIKYWDLEFKPLREVPENEWMSRIFELLKDSVKMRLISDVPLGAFLSGGVDSSIVVAMMSQVQTQPVKTFTIGFEDEDFSEIEYARVISKQFNTDHHELIVKPDAIDLLPKLAWQFDEPFGDSSAIPTYYVSKMAREEVKVVLSGDGGDELFSGYDHYRVLKRFSGYQWIPQSVRKICLPLILSVIPNGAKGRGFVSRLSMTPQDLAFDVSSIYPEPMLSKILSRDFKHVGSEACTEIKNNYIAYFQKLKDTDVVSKMQYTDIKRYLVDDILVKVDRASMLNSLEVRVPILDHRLVELAATIPIDYKWKDGETKYILKKTFKHLIPSNVLYRPKMGFALPISRWFNGELAGYTRDLILNGNSHIGDFFQLKELESILNAHTQGRGNHAARIWSLLFLEQWMKAWRKSS